MFMLEVDGDDADALEFVRTACDANAEVFARDDGGGYLLLCAQSGQAPARVRVTRLEELFRGGRTGSRGGGVVLRAGLWAPSPFATELMAWYRYEHMPFLLDWPGWDGCRFFRAADVADGCQCYAFHQLADAGTLACDARLRSRETPWFQRLSAQEWFDEPFTRTVCQRVEP